MSARSFTAETSWLPEVADRIQHNLDTGTPPLLGTPLDVQTYHDAAGVFFDPQVLKIAAAIPSRDAQSVSVRGTAALLGWSTLPVVLGYSEVDGCCYFGLRVNPPSLPLLDSLEKLGLPGAGLLLSWRYGPLATDSKSDPLPASSHLSLEVTVTLANMPLSVVIEPPQKPDTSGLWRLHGRFDAIPLGQLEPIAQWIQATLDLPEPPVLGQQAGLQLSGVDFVFDPSKPCFVGGTIAISATQPWPLAGQQLVLDQAVLMLSFSSLEKNYSFHSGFSATLDLGGEIVLVAASLDTSTGCAELSLCSDEAVLPGIGALGRLAALPGLSDTVPAAFQELGGLHIAAFELQVDTRAGRVSGLHTELAFPGVVPIAPKTQLENLRLTFDLAPQTANPVSGLISGLLECSGHYIGLLGELEDGNVVFSGTLASLPLSALAGRLTGGLPDSFPEIDLSNLAIRLDLQGHLHFEASVEIDFHTLAGALKVPVPHGMDAIHLSLLILDIHSDGAWNLALETGQRFSFPLTGEKQAGLDLHDLRLSFGRDGSGKFSVDGGFVLSGRASISDLSLELPGDGLATRFSENEWQGQGIARVTVFGRTYEGWSAAFDKQTFRVSRHQPLMVFREPFASAIIDRFAIALVRKGTQQNSSQWGFDVQGDGTLTIPGLTESASGHLAIDTATQRLTLSARQPPIPRIPLAPPLALDLSMDELSLSSNDDVWSFGGHASLDFKHVPESLKRYLPPASGNLQFGEQGVSLVCQLNEPIDFGPLWMKIGDKEVPLGNPRINLQTLEMDFGKEPAAAVQMQVDIPRELNCLLGWNDRFQPTTIFLNPSMDLRLAVERNHIGLALVNDTSPFKALKSREGQCKWVLDGFGTFLFDVPTFAFQADSWKCSLGMAHGPLSIPLRPVKFLMDHLGIPGRQWVPDSVPIRQDLDLKQLGSILPQLLGTDIWNSLPKEVADLVKQMLDSIATVSGEVESKYPEDFVDYLAVHIPDTIHLDIDTSGPSFSLWTDDDKPLKFLLPWFASLPPGLAGFTLKKVQFGQFAGTLVLLTVDGHADYFDVVTLAVSALPNVEARKFRNRLQADSLLAVVPSVFPFPIPLFYDDLSWELNSWTGLGLTTDWNMPAECNLLQTGSAIFQFFTDKNYLLSQDARQAFDIQFEIGPNAISLPDCLGGGVVGRPYGVKPVLPLGDSFKRLLDSLKTGNLTYLITAIPLHDEDQTHWYRLGMKKDQVNFGPLSFSAGLGWCAVTQEELNRDVLPNPKARAVLGVLDAEDVLHSLPTKACEPAYQKGFVVMLMGEAGVQPLLEARGYFGMALSAERQYDPANEGGFESGFLLQGTLAESLILRVRGDIHVARDHTTTVHGDCALLMSETELIANSTTVTVGKDLFDMPVTLRLAGDACQLVGGFHIDAREIFVKGDLTWAYGHGAGQSISGTDIKATIYHSGIAIGLQAVQWFDVSADITLFVDVAEETIGARANIDVHQISGYVSGKFQMLAADLGATTRSLQKNYQNLLSEYQGNLSFAQALARFLRGLVKDLPGMVKKEVTKAAPWGFRGKVWAIAQDQLKPILNDLTRLSNELEKADAKHAKGLIIGLIDQVLGARVRIVYLGKT